MDLTGTVRVGWHWVSEDLLTEIAADEASHLKDFQTALAAVTGPDGGASVPAGTTGAPVVIAAGPPRSSGTTLANLTTAMQGEAFAYAKYMRYADHVGFFHR